MVDKNDVVADLNLSGVKLGDTISFDKEIRMTIDRIKDKDGKIWIPLYTDEEEIAKGATPPITVNLDIAVVIEEAYYNGESCGLVINPFGQALTLPKDILKLVLDYYEENKEN